MLVYITRKLPIIAETMLSEAGIDFIVNEKDESLSREELKTALKQNNPDAVLCLLTDKIDAEIFDCAPNAKLFANYAIGFNNICVKEATARGISVTNTPGAFAECVAEESMALLLAVARRIVECDAHVRSGNWNGWSTTQFLGTSIIGKTLGIIGAGRIGTSFAKMCAKGFGMRVLYFDTNKNNLIEKETKATFCAVLDDCLKKSDVISLHVPLNEYTHHLINKTKLSIMRPDAILINTSRGAVVDEDALVDALKNNVIKGAGIDVFENEPMLAQGLAELKNVVLAPHRASATEQALNQMAVIAVKNIIEFSKGNRPPNLVK